jgi:predicted nucleotidyltransferase
MDLTPAQLKIVKATLQKHLAGIEVRAFGSRVQGKAKTWSDLDLAVISDKKISPIIIENLRTAFAESDLPFRVDILDWHDISSEFRALIDAKYEVIQSARKDISTGHLTLTELEEGLTEILLSPKDEGTLELIVRRPRVEEREIVETGELRPDEGLVGDSWRARGSSSTKDGKANPETQLTIMNSRAISVIAGDQNKRHLAGDQLYIDLDLSASNLPPGVRLALGEAVIEITAKPHTGCATFAKHFGSDAVKFLNSPEGKRQNLRGIHAKVIVPGVIRKGDKVKKILIKGS